MRSNEVTKLLNDACDLASRVLEGITDPTAIGERDGQYRLDLAVDAPLIALFGDAGFGVLSEEAGELNLGRDLVAVIDPVDGSTNASLGLPWYATSICIVDESGPVQAIVANHATGDRFEAVRGLGATNRGSPILPSSVSVTSGVVGINGMPPNGDAPGAQFRCFGAAALDLCAVASGSLNGYVDFDTDAHGVWDYLGAQLICAGVGVSVEDAFGRELFVLEHGARRTPVAATTEVDLAELLALRRESQEN